MGMPLPDVRKKTNDYMRQCLLRRGTNIQTTWIPEKYAKKGKFLKLKDRNSGEWISGWQIEEIWTRERADIVNERSRDHLHQRKASDI